MSRLLRYFSKCEDKILEEGKEKTDWRSYLDQMETGDLLLFHGSNFWFSYVVEWATWSEFSHIGIVLKDPTWIRPDLKGIYMLESGTEKFPDAVEHKIHYGIQVVSMEKLMSNYCGRVYFKKLNRPDVGSELPVGVASSFDQVVNHVWKKIEDLPYDDDLWDLMRAEFGIKWGDMHRMNKFFCSALVTFLYERFGLFKSDVNWDSILPEDYNDGKKAEKDLIPEYSLSSKVLLQEKYNQ